MKKTLDIQDVFEMDYDTVENQTVRLIDNYISDFSVYPLKDSELFAPELLGYINLNIEFMELNKMPYLEVIRNYIIDRIDYINNKYGFNLSL